MATKTKKAKESASVDSIRHKDQRANIPTEELRDFVASDEKVPKAMLHLFDLQPPLPEAEDWQDRCQGDQPLWR